MNKNSGYAIKEFIILAAILAIAFTVAISKFSFAYQNISDENKIEEEENSTIKIAAQAYVKTHEKEMKKDAENYIFGKDLIENGFLISTEENDYKDIKIKITYQIDQKKYLIDIIKEN